MTYPAPKKADNHGARFRREIVRQARLDWLDPYDTADEYNAEIGWRTGHNDDWCGTWAGAVAVRAGLAKTIALRVMPSTYRLATDVEGEPGWSSVDYNPPEPVAPADVQPGDIVAVKTSGGKTYGDHIAIVYAVLGDKIYTYEGNTRAGITADIERPTRRSVCRCVRDMADIRRVYRFEWRHREAA